MIDAHQLVTERQYELFSIFTLVAFLFIYFKLSAPFSGGTKGGSQDVPIAPPTLLSDLIPLKQGTIAGCKYAAVASSDGRIDIFVTLKRPLDFRLVISGDGNLSTIETDGLQRLDLEGNFPDEFQVYCQPGREAQALELLDPADMVYLIDFCKGHELRFEGDSFIISQPVRPEIGDTTSVLTDAEAFIKHNRVFWKQFE